MFECEGCEAMFETGTALFQHQVAHIEPAAAGETALDDNEGRDSDVQVLEEGCQVYLN